MPIIFYEHIELLFCRAYLMYDGYLHQLLLKQFKLCLSKPVNTKLSICKVKNVPH